MKRLSTNYILGSVLSASDALSLFTQKVLLVLYLFFVFLQMGKLKQKKVELLQIENGRTVILFQAIDSEAWGMKSERIIRMSQLRPGLTACMRTPLSWWTWRHPYLWKEEASLWVSVEFSVLV